MPHVHMCTHVMMVYPVVDVNECTEGTAVCDDDMYCLNTPGSYSCKGVILYCILCSLFVIAN